MGFAAVWKAAGENGSERILIGHPGTFTDTADEAKEEGRKVLSDASIEPDVRFSLMPLAVLQITDEQGDKIQECEEVELGDELLFYDISGMEDWAAQTWWPVLKSGLSAEE